jgi:hypothetical protein
MKLYRDRALLSAELTAALDRGLVDEYLIDQARELISTRPSADDLAKRQRVLRQLRAFVTHGW